MSHKLPVTLTAKYIGNKVVGIYWFTFGKLTHSKHVGTCPMWQHDRHEHNIVVGVLQTNPIPNEGILRSMYVYTTLYNILAYPVPLKPPISVSHL